MLDNATHFLLLTALILIIIVCANMIMGTSCAVGYYSTHDLPNADNLNSNFSQNMFIDTLKDRINNMIGGNGDSEENYRHEELAYY